MRSGKQKRAAIMARRQARREAATPIAPAAVRPKRARQVNLALLAPHCSDWAPAFVGRGYYEDLAFTCRDCGAHQVWTAEQQQWWYETAQGDVYTTAVRCLACRQARRRKMAGTIKENRQ
ncbi:zinc-ribbon domain-containing protein [Chitinimonas koreensis]|uniref:zinc-ribbon domain-containing protein n=1 Tax=Chitinimonas koreensis TaxID=356302 RepID=UPI0003FF2B8B|nr:zinc-ribbon domain-containing protein [Chitinimonas koreensis]QNM97754.1 zinc-ribbon domain-containing protein [Chitinimonas koreensis]